MEKSLKFIVKTYVLEGLAGCVRERKRYQTNIQNNHKIQAKINTQSMQSLCSKQMQKTYKIIKNRAQKKAKNCSKNNNKSMSKFDAKDSILAS